MKPVNTAKPDMVFSTMFSFRNVVPVSFGLYRTSPTKKPGLCATSGCWVRNAASADTARGTRRWSGATGRGGALPTATADTAAADSSAGRASHAHSHRRRRGHRPEPRPRAPGSSVWRARRRPGWLRPGWRRASRRAYTLRIGCLFGSSISLYPLIRTAPDEVNTWTRPCSTSAHGLRKRPIQERYVMKRVIWSLACVFALYGAGPVFASSAVAQDTTKRPTRRSTSGSSSA